MYCRICRFCRLPCVDKKLLAGFCGLFLPVKFGISADLSNFVKRKQKGGKSMMTYLTVKVDSGLLETISRYAQSKGKTVADLIEAQLRKLVDMQESKVSDKPVSSRLRGVVKLPKDFDYKKALENRNV